MMSESAPVWVMLGSKHGDNRQLLAIADALGVPYRRIPLHFNLLAALPPLVLSARRLSWDTDAALGAPWPKLVLSAGRKSVAAALWIRQCSRGLSRLVHVNRPWAPLEWFDLVVTTPQYGLPARPNVLANLLPFTPTRAANAGVAPASMHARLADLPRPWTAALLGGNARPLVFDESARRRLIGQLAQQQVATGGSVVLVESPRTPRGTIDAIAAALPGPHHLVRWREKPSPLAALMTLADRFVVTNDSASMTAEALVTGKPVEAFALTTQPDWRVRATRRWQHLADAHALARRSFERASEAGLLTSTRDTGRLTKALNAAGLFADGEHAVARAAYERRRTLKRIRALLESADQPLALPDLGARYAA